MSIADNLFLGAEEYEKQRNNRRRDHLAEIAFKEGLNAHMESPKYVVVPIEEIAARIAKIAYIYANAMLEEGKKHED